MSTDPISTPIVLNNEKEIKAVEINDDYNFLGFKLSYSDKITDIIEKNFKSKLFNIAKFYAWLQYNEQTPFFVKLKVLYGCVFPSILYSAETWGDLKKIEPSLRAMETKALKSCLGVKSGTSSDIIYTELNRPDIISLIKDRQYKFKNKVDKLNDNEALMKEIWQLCIQKNNVNLCLFYQNLAGNNTTLNMNNRKLNIQQSNKTMIVRYRSIIGLDYSSILYDSCLDDEKRKIISRWRLSSHKLRVETGRYSIPKIDPANRLCKICLVFEDESHSLFHCRAHRSYREKFENALNLQNNDIKALLNPRTLSEANLLAKYLQLIEKNMKDLDMTIDIP